MIAVFSIFTVVISLMINRMDSKFTEIGKKFESATTQRNQLSKQISDAYKRLSLQLVAIDTKLSMDLFAKGVSFQEQEKAVQKAVDSQTSNEEIS
ncbi:MAG: hypothetical protein HC932_02115 [Thermales bacterium]|nr:hypothetical protein [Thermales bacterium]